MVEPKFNSRSIAVIMPGQASQEKGMGIPAAEASENAMRVFEVGSYIANIDLLEYCRNTETKDMAEPTVQPALGAAVLANFELAKEFGLEPSVTLGKSVSEILSMRAANVFDLEDTFRILNTRGIAMYEANKDNPSVMAAFIGPSRRYFQWLAARIPNVHPAIHNSRFNNVVSGHPEAIEAMEKLARRIDRLKSSAKSRFNIDLDEVRSRAKTLVTIVKDDGGSHSKFMEGAVAAVTAEVERAEKNPPEIPVILNDGNYLGDDTGRYAPYLGGGLATTAHWENSIWTAIDSGIRLFFEVDAGTKGLITKDLQADFPDHRVINMPFGKVIEIVHIPEDQRPEPVKIPS